MRLRASPRSRCEIRRATGGIGGSGADRQHPGLCNPATATHAMGPNGVPPGGFPKVARLPIRSKWHATTRPRIAQSANSAGEQPMGPRPRQSRRPAQLWLGPVAAQEVAVAAREVAMAALLGACGFEQSNGHKLASSKKQQRSINKPRINYGINAVPNK